MTNKGPDIPYLKLVEKTDVEEFDAVVEARSLEGFGQDNNKSTIIDRCRNFLYWKDLKISTILIGLSAFSFLILFISFVILATLLG